VNDAFELGPYDGAEPTLDRALDRHGIDDGHVWMRSAPKQIPKCK